MKSPFFLFSALSGLLYSKAFMSYSGMRILTRHSLYPSRSIQSVPLRRSSSFQVQAKKSPSEKSQGQKQKSLAPHYSPKTTNQKAYWKYLNDPNVSIVLGTGPAGTGKTLFACNTAIQLLKRGDIQKIVLTRPVVAVEEDLGFLPGNLVMKMDPWTRPIFDILLEFYSQKDVDAMVQSGVIEISPLAYMRGRTFKRAFIIADEMQNSSPNQMMMLTTRIGEGSKMVITGDLKQSDRSADNGLLDLMQKLRGFRLTNPKEADELRIRAVEMSMEDVERSAVVKQVLELYETPAYRVVPRPADVVLSHGISNHVISNGVVAQEVVRDVIANAVANADMVAVSEDTTSNEDTATNEDTPTPEDPTNEDTENEDPTNEDPANNGAFELVTYDDAALIPKKHISKHMPGNEDYHHYSSRKWSGW